MQQSGKNPFILKKSFEVAYALFRVSTNITDAAFAGMLKEEATRLMGNTAKEHYAEAAKSITAIEYFVRLAAEVNFINFSNTEILLREIGNLNTAIAELPDAAINTATKAIDLSDIFSEASIAGEQILFESKKRESKKESISTDRISRVEESYQSAQPEENNSLKAATRQTAILERIRQSGNCRLRDILEFLPDSSERTIRYDLQSLAEQNLVERVGNGGPAVFYRIRQGAATPAPAPVQETTFQV